MPTPTYTPLQTITLSGSASTVTFGSIPGTYRDLVFVFDGGVTSGNRNLVIAFNSDTTNSNYAAVQMSGTGSAADGTAFLSTQTRFLNYYGYMQADLNCQIVTQIFDYSATDKHKTYLSRSSHASNGTSAVASRWANTNAITSIQLSQDGAVSFASGSTFSLYGIAA